MPEVQSLDTSGVVRTPFEMAARAGTKMQTAWSDLDDFTQGYVEALFESAVGTRDGKGLAFYGHGFRNLAPETLAWIVADCTAYENDVMRAYPAKRRRNAGTDFWAKRQRGAWGPQSVWLPVTIFLSDEGKVCLREAKP